MFLITTCNDIISLDQLSSGNNWRQVSINTRKHASRFGCFFSWQIYFLTALVACHILFHCEIINETGVYFNSHNVTIVTSKLVSWVMIMTPNLQWLHKNKKTKWKETSVQNQINCVKFVYKCELIGRAQSTVENRRKDKRRRATNLIDHEKCVHTPKTTWQMSSEGRLFAHSNTRFC